MDMFQEHIWDALHCRKLRNDKIRSSDLFLSRICNTNGGVDSHRYLHKRDSKDVHHNYAEQFLAM